MPILTLAMPIPLRRSFDYLPPESMSEREIAALKPGVRFLAPFGNRKLSGVLIAVKSSSDLPDSKLKSALQLLDNAPIFSDHLMSLCLWAANYYHHPIGEVFANAMPTLLRKGAPQLRQMETRWRLSTEGKGLPEGALKRAAKQAQLLAILQTRESIDTGGLERAGLSRAVAKAMVEKNLLERYQADVTDQQTITSISGTLEPALSLSSEQRHAFETINASDQYQCYLLDGVTGSGKTEVYLQLIAQCLQKGLQALVLIPEIGLTPQTTDRFKKRFDCLIVVLHSGLSDRERLLSWQLASSGEAKIIIGTRSAVFCPMPTPGLIIIDEEHDNSFKQQDGFRYNARDLAIMRAHREQCPIVLGSATPSLETLNNALQGRYQHLQLTERAGGASPPTFELLDVRNSPMDDGFSPPLLAAIKREIGSGNQVLVFINRRGFAPVLMCHDCGFIAQCPNCDARMTVHFGQRLLRCHHCESRQALPQRCPDCNSPQLDFRGSGTERSEQALKRIFSTTPIIRIDRDTTSRKHAMRELVTEVHRGDPCILVGTQMLAKGHHFPDITLVAVLDADGGLFSTDFRGPEKMGQLLTQVAGRAGRAAKSGTVMIQTLQAEHPLIISLVDNQYKLYAAQLLRERELSGMPPFAHLALVRAEATSVDQAEAFLRDLRIAVDDNEQSSLSKPQFVGPLPAPMTRRAGFYRAQLLIRCTGRKTLHHSLAQLCQVGDRHPLGKKLRWSVDVDPVDML